MSNGDDVLDNWEEIDEAGLDNTVQKIQEERKTAEQFNSINAYSAIFATPPASGAKSNIPATSSTEFQPMKLLQRTVSTQDSGASNNDAGIASPLDNMAATFQPVMMVLHKPNDEYQSANYTQPISSQTVKILRRPAQHAEQRNNDTRPRQPIKTLQQREQEYAEARLRIMGSAKNPEDDESAANANNAPNAGSAPTNSSNVPSNKINTSPKQQQLPQQLQHIGQNIGMTVQNNQYMHPQHQPLQLQHHPPIQQQQQQFPQLYYQHQLPLAQPTSAFNNRTLPMQQTWSPVVGGSVSSTPAMRQQAESVARLPRGPDGSTGFQMRR